jgi:RNA-directed DNA polymerase
MYYIRNLELMSIRDTELTKELLELLGRINFVLQINPKDTEFIRYKSFLIDLKRKNI